MSHRAELVVQQVIQAWVPSLPASRQRQLSRWVLGAVLAGNANGPAIIQALANAGVARSTTLTEQWAAWRQHPAHQTSAPPAAGAAPVVSPRAAGADLLRRLLTRWTDDRVVLGLDASYRRADVVLLRLRVLYRGTAVPVSWVIMPANTPGAWTPHWERLRHWAATVLAADRLVLVVADRGWWSPRLWHAIRQHGWHPGRRVQAAASFTPTGQRRQRVLELVGGPGRGWIGTGTAFKHVEKRLAGTLATVWDPDADEAWALLAERPPTQRDPAWYALRMWDAAGFRASKSLGWAWQRGQLDRPDAVAWQYLVVAVAPLGTLALGTRLEDAQQHGVAPGRLRQPPTSLPARTRRSGTAQRISSLLRQGQQQVRWLLARARTWVRRWLRPEPWPQTLDRCVIHIHDPC